MKAKLHAVSTVTCILAVMAVAQPALQAAEVSDFGVRTPSPADFVKALAMPKTRGIRPVEPKIASVELKFDFDSATLTDPAKQTLNSLGAALQNAQLQHSTFRIEGHTDGKGAPEYNQTLSERRAESVKRYLTQNFNIPAARLETIGMGAEYLKNAENPLAAENRRVQIVNLGN